MCGIFSIASYGAANVSEIASDLVDGLRALEYRGYDGAGICLAKGTNILYFKKTEDDPEKYLEEIKNDRELSNISGNIMAISHTRWSTHGRACPANAHPMSDSKEEFFLVHNGIISNAAQLKEKLKDYPFKSQTDTEVAVALASRIYEANPELDLRSIVAQVTEQCQGSSAFLFISKKHPDEMVAISNFTALVVGEMPTTDSQGRKYSISSDLNSTQKLADRCFQCPLHTFIRISPSGLELSKVVKRNDSKSQKFCNISYKMDSVQGNKEKEMGKNGYGTYMEKEIHQQADAVAEIVKRRVNFKTNEVRLKGLENNIKDIRNARRLIFTGIGTSYHSCLAATGIINTVCEMLGIYPLVLNAMDFTDLNTPVFKDDVVFMVSQSGETAELLNVLKICKERGALCVALTNQENNSLFNGSDCGVRVKAGAEFAVASTKAYTCQCLALTLIMLAIAQGDERETEAFKKERAEIVKSLGDLSTQITLATGVDVQKACEKIISGEARMIIGGRGMGCSLCYEAALKINEITYKGVLGISAGDLKHGPLALVDKGSTPLMVITNSVLDGKPEVEDHSYEQITARGGEPIVFCTDSLAAKYSKRCILIPSTHPFLQCMITIVPLQKVSLLVSLSLNINPDKPRNLAKSVTVN